MQSIQSIASSMFWADCLLPSAEEALDRARYNLIRHGNPGGVAASSGSFGYCLDCITATWISVFSGCICRHHQQIVCANENCSNFNSAAACSAQLYSRLIVMQRLGSSALAALFG